MEKTRGGEEGMLRGKMGVGEEEKRRGREEERSREEGKGEGDVGRRGEG